MSAVAAQAQAVRKLDRLPVLSRSREIVRICSEPAPCAPFRNISILDSGGLCSSGLREGIRAGLEQLLGGYETAPEAERSALEGKISGELSLIGIHGDIVTFGFLSRILSNPDLSAFHKGCCTAAIRIIGAGRGANGAQIDAKAAAIAILLPSLAKCKDSLLLPVAEAIGRGDLEAALDIILYAHRAGLPQVNLTLKPSPFALIEIADAAPLAGVLGKCVQLLAKNGHSLQVGMPLPKAAAE